jgi:murein DD-endopeptidase MepM/ murein hydrolase activator NlpD
VSLPRLPDDRSGFTIRIPAVFAPFLALVAVVVVMGGMSLAQRNRMLEADAARLLATAQSAARHERELQATIARQEAYLNQREAEVAALRRHIEAVEIQLDGLDVLSRQTRESLGLPPSAGTWSDGTGAALAQGGPSMDGGDLAPSDQDHERLDLVQRRLAAGVGEMYRLAAAARAAQQSALGTPAAAVAVPTGQPANWPARGEVSSVFGWRVFRGQQDFHTGIDIVLPYGTAVQAAGPGLVVGSGWQPGYGWCVLVDHGGGFHTLYAHLSATALAVGDSTAPGDVVGYSGSSGNSTGPHLHYEIWRDGQPVDPRPYMDGTGPG